MLFLLKFTLSDKALVIEESMTSKEDYFNLEENSKKRGKL